MILVQVATVFYTFTASFSFVNSNEQLYLFG